ncbi:MAG TPA: DUF222 domain-containing protein [Acidimicrobiales bacterium]|nr:DUF222 domain-containing protein [Acidimicrobiales bacterium]
MDLLDSSAPVSEAAAGLTTGDLRMALVEAAASIAAAQARLAQAMAIFRNRSGESEGSGFTSFGQWASVDLGLSSRAASGLADAGDALTERPEVREAWESGSLSTTKAQCVLGVATDASESSWCELAKEASATQLSRIASAYRRSQRADTEAEARRQGREAEDREAVCGAFWHTRDDGLRELLAILTPDDAAVVQAALETEIETQWRAEHGGDTNNDDDAAAVSAPLPTAKRRLDALVAVAANRLEAGPVPIVRGEHTEVVLHIDAEFLCGATDGGLCDAKNAPGLTLADARRLACDAKIRGLVRGADGTAVDLGRVQRLASDKQRRLLAARDHGCRFPGCANSRYVDAHHVIEWEDGGPTDMANLVLLCNRHHRLVHHGAFRIDADGEQGFSFIDQHDHLIRPPDLRARHRCRGVPGNPRAGSGGDPRYSIDDAVTAMASAS